MKILTLTQIEDKTFLNEGLVLIKQWANFVPFEFILVDTTKQFSSIPFSNETNSNGYQVNPVEIFQEAKSKNIPFDIDLLVFDWTKITPQPTNPTQNGTNMQIAENWCGKNPEVFAQFFLHELCHYFYQKTGLFDMTHLMVNRPMNPTLYDQFAQQPIQNYYLCLLRQFATPTVTITRQPTQTRETLGTLVANNGGATLTCKTLELPDKNNIADISCIPKGTYQVKWTFSPRLLKFTYEIQNVPKRSGIRFHSANYYFQLNGCIALGSGFADINGDGTLDVVNSRATIDSFNRFMNKQQFTLIVN
ncbi:MAG: DUF5675 family protein [bacterium]